MVEPVTTATVTLFFQDLGGRNAEAKPSRHLNDRPREQSRGSRSARSGPASLEMLCDDDKPAIGGSSLPLIPTGFLCQHRGAHGGARRGRRDLYLLLRLRRGRRQAFLRLRFSRRAAGEEHCQAGARLPRARRAESGADPTGIEAPSLAMELGRAGFGSPPGSRAAAVWFAREHGAWAPREAVEATAIGMPKDPGVAVLPFVNLSGDANQEYFSDGLTKDILTELARTPDLRVLAGHPAYGDISRGWPRDPESRSSPCRTNLGLGEKHNDPRLIDAGFGYFAAIATKSARH